MKKYRVIVMGLGKIGMKYGFDSKRKQPASHVNAVIQNQNLELVAVCDPDPKSRDLFIQKYGNNIKVFEDSHKMLDKINCGKLDWDIISIATPDSTHNEILKLIIKNYKKNDKKIIFCEKPITLNFKDANEIKSIMKNPQLKIVINHIRRWNEIWNKAYLLKKDLGKIKKAVFYFSTSPENVNFDQLRDGSHIADVISWFNLEDIISVHRLDVPYFMWDFYLWGTKGKIEILNVDSKLVYYKVNDLEIAEGVYDLNVHETITNIESTMKNAYNEFVEFLNGQKTSLTTDLDDAITALQIFEKYVYDKNFIKVKIDKKI